MPFTKDDVERHNKGLTDSQKAQWVAVANSVLERCKKNGGTDKSCAPSAIRQANGVVSTNQLHINTNNAEYILRKTMHKGKEHLVVPIVMMVEGVHHGSRGPLYHPAQELGRAPQEWNGMPIMIDHPKDSTGQYISAFDETVINNSVGEIFNTTFEGNKLKGEGYLDPDKLQEMSPAAFTSIINAQPIEVSIGVFTDEDEQTGMWNNEQYNAIARNHRPDHLALLPGGTGACSMRDGCGVRVNSENKKKGGNEKMSNLKFNVNEEKVEHLQSILENNMDQGYRNRLESTQRMLDAMDNQTASHYLEDMNNTHVVYSKRNRDTNGRKMYQQSYEMDANGIPSLIGNPQEVVSKLQYVPVTNNKNNNSKGGNKMNGNEGCGKCMEKVIAIIQSNANPFTSSDREFLLGKEESWLDSIPVRVEATPVNNTEVKITREMVLNALSPEERDALDFGTREKAARREKWIKGIQANTEKDLWLEADLKGASDAFLEKLHSSVVKLQDNEEEEDVVYALNGNSRKLSDNETIQPLYPVGIEVENKK